MRPDKASRRARMTRHINRRRVILSLHVATVGDAPTRPRIGSSKSTGWPTSAGVALDSGGSAPPLV